MMDEGQSPVQLAKLGKLEYECGNYQNAALFFDAAQVGYTTAGDIQNSAEMANNSSVAYLRAGKAEAALKAVQGTDDTFAQFGDLHRQGMAVGNKAAALDALGRLQEAAEAYQQSIDLLSQSKDDELRTFASQSLSSLQLRMGQQLQALATMQSGMEGIKHPSFKQRLLNRLLKIPFGTMIKRSE
jgi:tetratricopeptide (TPR) repeat protein